MKLVLLRHATRSPFEGGDCSLNQVGAQQAEDLLTHIAPQGRLPRPTRLISSPKRRAKETVKPLGASELIQPEIEPRLDERRQNETSREFEGRVRDYLNDITKGHESCIYLCTHHDWLEAAILAMPHDLPELESSRGFSTAEYRVFEVIEGLFQFKAQGVVGPRKEGM